MIGFGVGIALLLVVIAVVIFVFLRCKTKKGEKDELVRPPLPVGVLTKKDELVSTAETVCVVITSIKLTATVQY